MNRLDLIKEMKDSVGTQNPEVYFQKMTELFNLLFDKMDELTNQMNRVQLNSTMAIYWDERLALKMIDAEIKHMRMYGKDPLLGGNIYSDEIQVLQGVYKDSSVIKSYPDFCQFWQDILGYHPFLDARE